MRLDPVTRVFRLAACAALLLAAAPAPAQRVYWQQPLAPLEVGENAQLTLVFENCGPSGGMPAPPKIDGLEVLGGTSRSEQTSIINGRYTHTIMFFYAVRPTRDGAIRIPPLSVNTDRGVVTVPEIELQAGAGAGRARSQVFVAVLRADKESVWLGEVFHVEFLLLRHANAEGEVLSAGNIEWQPEGLTVEGWSQPADISTTVDGQPYVGWRYIARCAASRAGLLGLPEASIKVRTQKRFTIMSIITSSVPHDVTVTSLAASIEVKPLPSPEPPGFTGAVGLFQLASKVVPRAVSVGEPITWTLELTGTGNWDAGPTLPARDVSTDFRVHQPKARLDQHENVVFDGALTEDVVLIPTQPGTYTLGPVSWSFFSPAANRYETLKTENAEVTVAAAPQQGPPSGAVPLPSTTAQPAPGAGTRGAARAPQPEQPVFDLIPSLPRDPLLGTASTLRPIGAAAVWLCLVPALGLAIFWMYLARDRSLLTDGRALRRQAQKAALDALARLPVARDPAAQRAALTLWMKSAAQRWGLPQQAASREFFFAALRREHASNAAAVETWQRLWSEAEQAVYAPKRRLPSNWVARARAALLAHPVPRAPLPQVFLPRNLWPLLALAASALAPQRSRADDAAEAYRAGDFAKAESLFAARIARAPTDWKARNNLALVLAQQDRWTEAAAYWTAARVLNPRDASIAWNLGIALDKAGIAPAAIAHSPQLAGFFNAARDVKTRSGAAAFLAAAHPARLFGWFSPAQWQWLLIMAAGLAAAGLAPALLARYRGRFAGPIRAVLAAPLLASALAVLALLAQGHYGVFADHNAAIVATPAVLRSIPTDIETQETKDLPPGTPGVIIGDFLTWRRLRLPNGETGWVRASHLVPIYLAPVPKRETPGA